MKVLDNIERVKAPSAEIFWRTYVVPGRPVILTELYDYSELKTLGSVQEVRNLIGAQPLQARQPITALFTDNSKDLSPYSTTVTDFLDLQFDGPPDRVASEVPMPSPLALLISPHPYRELRDATDTKGLMFLAHRGHRTALHYDGDGRDVLHTPVLGAKRVSVIPGGNSQRVNPRLDLANHSSFCPGEMPADEYLDLLRYCGGFDTVLEPGETIYIPSLAWHYFEYPELSLAFAFKLGRTPYVRFIWDHLVPLLPAGHRHTLADITHHFVNEPVEESNRTQIRALLSAFQAAYPYNPNAFGQFFSQLERLHERLCPQEFVRAYTENDERRLRAPRRLEAPPVSAVWKADSVPRWVDGLYPAAALGGDGPTHVMFIRDGQVVDELEVQAGGRTLARMLGRLVGNRDATVEQLALEAQCGVDEIIGILKDMGRKLVCTSELREHQRVRQVIAPLREILGDDPPG